MRAHGVPNPNYTSKRMKYQRCSRVMVEVTTRDITRISREIQNLAGRVRSGREVFRISQVRSGRVKRFSQLMGRVRSGGLQISRVGSSRVGSGVIKISRVGSGQATTYKKQSPSYVFSSACGPFLALPVAGHKGAPPVHDGARLGPRRAPWSVLWASKVARARSFSRDCVPPRRVERAMQT